MCRAMPGRVVKLEGRWAEVEFGDGQRRRANPDMFPDLQEGDWGLVYLGMVVEKITAQEAEEMERFFEEMDEALRRAADEHGEG